MVNWNAKALGVIAGTSGAGPNTYRQANAAIIHKTVNGIGVDSGRSCAVAGIRLVYNMSSAYIPAMLLNGYKNCYDLENAKTGRVGGAPPSGVSQKRIMIDQAIAKLLPRQPNHESIYYGAIDLNGCGMRYYGDLCLVLKPATFPAKTVVLDRNSYDLQRPPIRDDIALGIKTLDDAAAELAGDRGDAADMLTFKILSDGLGERRLLTSGKISQAILTDEDYHEVPRVGSFSGADVAEIRTTAADATAEMSIGSQLAQGVTPSVTGLLWRQRRRHAAASAAANGLSVRVVIADGRVRS